MADVERYEPLIRQILSAPGVDLSTISAKRVRKQLVEMDDSLSTDFVRENKEEFDKVISSVYEDVSAAQSNSADAKGKRKSRDEEDAYENGGDEDDEEGEEEAEEDVKPSKAKRSKKGGLTDEEVAKQLDSEINGRQRSSRASSTSGRGRGRGGKRGGRRGAKSSATVNSDGEVDEDGEPKKKRRGGGFQKEYMIRYVPTPIPPSLQSQSLCLANPSWL